MSVANAQGAFRGSGLFPCNSAAIPDHAYAPSSTTERDAPFANEASSQLVPVFTTEPVLLSVPIVSVMNYVVFINSIFLRCLKFLNYTFCVHSGDCIIYV